ncbi:uncharacterized MFS-type transporter YhjX-like [Littorina saxatilis]|uniref:Major facilitator superfamily (MFS) profile domain-containing protein n=1 Tax=Littorina saxatilis TaxID=31220 RepID=A0AAN9G1B8_9CAEN
MTAESEVTDAVARVTCCKQKIPVRGILVVIGGILVHITLGTQLTYGNTNPYFVSYIRKHSSPSDLKYIDGIWVQACMLMGQGVTMFLGGLLEHKFGLRVSCLIGSWLMSAGVLLTYFTLKYNYITSVITYGIMFGLGCGIAYPMPVACAMKWFPNRRGLMGGLIFAGFGGGSTVFNQIITLFLNPDNISPDLTIGEDVYFTQDEVLKRVPSMFLVLGGTYAVLQLVGIILMVDPPPSYQEHSTQIYENVTTSESENKTPERKKKSEVTLDVWSTSVSEDDAVPQTKNIQENTDVRPEFESELPVENGNDTAAKVKAVEMDVHPLKMLRSKQFYLVWLLFLFGGMGGVFMAAMYKSYGQSFIKDDQFIAIVGSCAAVCNALGGIVWGYVADRFGFDIAAKLLYTMFASASFTFIGSQYGLKPYFFIWVCLILFAISGKFAIMPPVIARMYGNKYMSINYGLLYTSQILTSAASAFMGQLLKDYLHYSGLFFLIGGMSCIGFFITFFVDARMPDGKKI